MAYQTSASRLRRDLEADVKETGYTWKQLERLDQDRSAWMNHVGGLCSRRGDGGFDDDDDDD